MNKDIEFIKELKSYIPTRCRKDAGCDFNLKKVHVMIDNYLNNKNKLKEIKTVSWKEFCLEIGMGEEDYKKYYEKKQ